MGKFNHDKSLNGQRISRSLAAISLAASLAAFGCTSNHNLGNGTPTRSGPEVRTAPTSGVTTGGESTTPVTPNPPMTSSYNRSEVLPAVTTVKSSVQSASRTIRRLSPDEAAAVMAGRQALQGRYLGVVSPGAGSSRPYESASIQTYQNPAMLTNPQLTINSTISSPATPIDGIADTGAVVVTSADGTATVSTAPATVTTAPATVTPTLTQANGNTPSVTAASVGLGRTTAAATTTATTATTAAATSGATTAAGVRAGTVTSPVRIMRSTGNVTVTNVGTTGRTAVTTGRGQ